MSEPHSTRPLTICFIGRFPPLQGGTSSVAYWLAHGLVRRGHRVIVCTTSSLQESGRSYQLRPEDHHWLRLSGAGHRGKLIFCSTEASSEQSAAHETNGVEKLVSVAVQQIENFNAHVIFANYLDPYGLAASACSHRTGVPYVLTHAGTDAARMRENAQRVQEIIAKADLFVPKTAQLVKFSNRSLLCSIGLTPFSPPPELFSPTPAHSDIPHGTFAEMGRSSDFLDRRLVVGFLGKNIPSKDVARLLRCASPLADRVKFSIASGWPISCQETESTLLEHGFGDSAVTPFIPVWDVPGFLQRCDLISCLQNSLRITDHTPIVPLEALCCGIPVLTTSAVAARPLYRGRLRHNSNCIVLPADYSDSDVLSALKSLEDPSFRGRLAANARKTGLEFPSYGAFVTGWERAFNSVALR